MYKRDVQRGMSYVSDLVPDALTLGPYLVLSHYTLPRQFSPLHRTTPGPSSAPLSEKVQSYRTQIGNETKCADDSEYRSRLPYSAA